MKKGAISLSVNAIVILILAIVMLGLGVTFIKNMFGKASVQIEQMISQEPDPQVPYLSDPITLSREHIITTAGGTQQVLKVSVYNAWGAGGGAAATTSTDFNCGNVKNFYPSGPGDCTDPTAYCVPTQWWRCTNICNSVADVTGPALCSGATMGAGGVCTRVAALTKKCTDVGASAASPAGAVYSDGSNYVTCKGLGCGPSDGAHCTDVAVAAAATGDNATPEIWCSNDVLRENINKSLQTYTKSISSGETGSFNLVFDVGTAPMQSHLCQVRLKEQPTISKDFVIEIRKR